jgi:hypothetical protein
MSLILNQPVFPSPGSGPDSRFDLDRFAALVASEIKVDPCMLTRREQVKTGIFRKKSLSSDLPVRNEGWFWFARRTHESDRDGAWEEEYSGLGLSVEGCLVSVGWTTRNGKYVRHWSEKASDYATP